jgi:hypothetical protein
MRDWRKERQTVQAGRLSETPDCVAFVGLLRHQQVVQEVDACSHDSGQRTGPHASHSPDKREAGASASLSAVAFAGDQPGTQPNERIVAASRHLDGQRHVRGHRIVIANSEVCERGCAGRLCQRVGLPASSRSSDGPRGLGDRAIQIGLSNGQPGAHGGETDCVCL